MARWVLIGTIFVIVLALFISVSGKETGKDRAKEKHRASKGDAHLKKVQHEKLESPRHASHPIKAKHGAFKSHSKNLKSEKFTSLDHHHRQLGRHHPGHYVTKERTSREEIFKRAEPFLRLLPGHWQLQDKDKAMKSKKVEKKKKHLKSKRISW